MVYGKDAFSDLHFIDKLMPAKAASQWDDLQGFLDETADERGLTQIEEKNLRPSAVLN